MKLDEGYMYGLGAFETIAIENGHPILLDEHLERMNATLQFLGIDKNITSGDVKSRLDQRIMQREAMKIMVSEHNIIFHFRKNIYGAENYKNGFRLVLSEVLRNETSPLTYHKTLNYGENIIEKRKNKDYNEVIYLNMKKEICEGSTTNIFFVKNGRMKTPKASCGLLPGIIRSFLISHYEIEEGIILQEDIEKYDECFVTNSLMGIMPVRSLGHTHFTDRKEAQRLQKEYIQYFRLNER